MNWVLSRGSRGFWLLMLATPFQGRAIPFDFITYSSKTENAGKGVDAVSGSASLIQTVDALLAKHPPERWQRFLAEAGRVDRIAKGRPRIGEESTDAWVQLERLLLAMADKGATRLLAS